MPSARIDNDVVVDVVDMVCRWCGLAQELKVFFLMCVCECVSVRVT